MREPAFWWRGAGPQAQLLAPLGLIYGTIAARRMAKAGAQAGLPVLCVGNFTLGGAGKTPTVIMLAKTLADGGSRPFCLSRGYGGSEAGPRLVDGPSDSAAQVGDEALLLARAAPTIVARDRVAGAEFARTQGASVIILDDGLQNPSLAKDFTLAVINARRGIGNGRVFPAGPLRAPLDAQIARTNALLVVGEGSAADGIAARLHAQERPVFHARLLPDKAAVSALRGQNVLAFAGIGDPDKFFATAREAGIVVSRRRVFPDHHHYTPQDASELILRAEYSKLTLLTTEKDRARMNGDPRLAALAASVQTLPVTMVVQEAGELRRLIKSRLPH
jgi:tetraacyldisaccharide 4'-kinase